MRIVFAILVTVFVSGCCTWSEIPVSASDQRIIYVSSNGWHSSIILPKEHLDKSLSFVKKDLGECSYYEFGWGDKGFYQSEEITSGLTLQAVFWPTDSVMHIVAFSSSPFSYFPSNQTLKLTVSSKGLCHLREYISASFQKSGSDEVIKSKEGIYGKSFFYQGEGNYWLMNTCNTWTAKALSEAGTPVSSFMTIRAESVITQTQDAIEELEEILEKNEQKTAYLN